MADNVVSLPGARVLNTPERPPREWFNTDSPEFVMGQSLRVVTSGPDEGRAFGLIQPDPKNSAYTPGPAGRRHRQYGLRPPDARQYPDGFTTFNRGAVEATEADGGVVVVNAGRLTISGGHTQSAVAGASGLGDAVEWLNREGRHAARFEDVGFVGVASAVDVPGFEGAVMFRGAALPGMTSREAATVNAGSMSAELWPSPAHNDQLVFAGAVYVDHTAWPYTETPEAMAATADQPECVGPQCVIFGITPEPEPEPVAAASCACHNPDTTPIDTNPEPELEVEVVETPQPATHNPTLTPDQYADLFGHNPDGPVAAEVTENDFDTLRADVDRALETLETHGAEIGELGVTLYAPNVGKANETAGLAERIAELEATITALQEQLLGQQTDDNTDTNSSGPATQQPAVVTV